MKKMKILNVDVISTLPPPVVRLLVKSSVLKTGPVIEPVK
ncbi:hypothetical protein A2U01_0080594, partial [Trifolium medium]|nr:hypothetical protein [Trifolium medium]